MVYETELQHHGIKGQRWGFRRFQNKDGTLTEAGVNRRLKKSNELAEKTAKTMGQANAVLTASKGYRLMSTEAENANDKRSSKAYAKKSEKLQRDYDKLEKKTNDFIAEFQKNKWSTIKATVETEQGRDFMDSFLRAGIDLDKVREYESIFSKDSRYSEGYTAEHEHVRSLIEKRK